MSEIVSSGKYISIVKFRLTKSMLLLGYLSLNPQVFLFWNAQLPFIRLGPVRRDLWIFLKNVIEKV